ncbi:teneurin-2-like isoform X2 [Salvelinus fontinalis]|uniref:teneurin-2-like isoform X2 n=1 Tax=Salvelinus fontinalis TaxID=8038 RepID=UPI00248609B8|nr:teneurin-2-like isoform X2 [Salvelinus fontinalis]
MDMKERPHRSLTRGRCRKDFHHATVSLQPEECHVATQKSYSSSETLKAYDRDTHLHYGGCVAELVHHEHQEYVRQGELVRHEHQEYVRQGSFTLAELGVSDQQAQNQAQTQTQHQAAYHSSHSELGLLQRGYSLSAGSDADSDPEGVMSPERAVQLWGGHAIKSRRSSGVSSRENSALTLTDSDNEHKSDDESGRPLPPTPSSSLLPPAPPPPTGPSHPAPPAIRECQVPLLDSRAPHVMLDPPPDDEFSPNSYLLRACAPPPQPPSAGPPNHHHSQSLRPPLPPPHNHHQSSASSLNPNTLASRRGPAHAPSAAPGEGPSTPESVQLQDSWALNSSVPLETRHFLFKTPSGTTPLFSSSSPGYPLTSGTVYSPPPRLLPRNTFSRSSFKLKKPSKYCSWKCAAVSAIAAAILLVVLLSYFIGPWVYRNSSISTGELEVGRRLSQDVPPGVFWRSLLHLRQPLFLKFNISLGKDALFGVYIRKGLPPSHAQYDYMERLDGKEKWSVVESPRERRSIHTVVLNEAIFVQYLDPGTWHLAFYNDGKDKESVSFSTVALGGCCYYIYLLYTSIFSL